MHRLFLSLLFASTIHAAEKPCPWMNAATAGGILEGPVAFTITKTSCEFTRLEAGAKLRIEVGQADLASYKSQCARNIESLNAIGNEAIACSIDATTEQVAGRVRKQIFLVRLTGGSNLRDKAVNVAEQVAGSLF